MAPESSTPTSSRTEALYKQLRSAIISCRLPPNKRLKISDLAEYYIVSPGAVREALSRLTSENLVVSETHRGFKVSPISNTDLEDLTNVRIDIETQCLRRSISNASIEWESALVAASHTLNKIAEQASSERRHVSDEWAEAHQAFHSALVAACDSVWLLRIRKDLYAQSERYRRLSVPLDSGDRDITREHDLILEASLARDADKAAKLLAEHMRRTTFIILDGN